ncbi:hypothetical protein AKJ09_05424 [Labilithrix luteola]|uniref:Uncharacterized protein n=1 Tax=Labilithrix luteola TaxID=1391654 RepID=A0A0K1PZ07_9BACT|nr:hypothetical protein [Labilithrix luteola]AKU98760.1 hypothetical protein AKJ09_05424 [Labilithrix luteola]
MLGLVLPLATAQDARAEGPIEPIAFDYAAPAECPSAEHVLRQITGYTTKWTLARGREDVRSFRLRAERRDQGYVGRFDLRDAKGTTVGREVIAETCEDVTLALAITVALAIDPRAAIGGAEEPPSAPREQATETPPAANESSSASHEATTSIAPAPSEKPAAHDVASPHVNVAVGTRVEGTTAVSGLLAVFDAFVELDVERTIAQVPWFRPVLRVGLRQSFTRTASVGEARVDIDWTAGQIEACPSRLVFASHLSADVCVGANVGELSATARDIPGAERTRRFWFDYGGLLAARWQAHPNFFAELVAASWVPRKRDRLRVEPDGVVSRAPAVGFSAGVGIGWRF